MQRTGTLAEWVQDVWTDKVGISEGSSGVHRIPNLVVHDNRALYEEIFNDDGSSGYEYDANSQQWVVPIGSAADKLATDIGVVKTLPTATWAGGITASMFIPYQTHNTVDISQYQQQGMAQPQRLDHQDYYRLQQAIGGIRGRVMGKK